MYTLGLRGEVRSPTDPPNVLLSGNGPPEAAVSEFKSVPSTLLFQWRRAV